MFILVIRYQIDVLMSLIQHRKVEIEEVNIRLDRWFKRHFPNLPLSRFYKLLRTGQIRVDGKRAKPDLRLSFNQNIRIPPIQSKNFTVSNSSRRLKTSDADYMRKLVLYMDDEIIVIDKPAGLAVQGGSRTNRHLDGMLDTLRFDASERPKLVHRLDKDTSGVMILARTTLAARWLAKNFNGRNIRKVYWAITVGKPEKDSGRIDLPLSKLASGGRERVGVDQGNGKMAITDYQVIEYVGARVTWIALWPRTGRTHQLRAHCVAIGCPILGDGKYGGRDAFIDGLPSAAKRLQLFAREITIPKISFGSPRVHVVAPLPKHMAEVWQNFEFQKEPDREPFE